MDSDSGSNMYSQDAPEMNVTRCHDDQVVPGSDDGLHKQTLMTDQPSLVPQPLHSTPMAEPDRVARGSRTSTSSVERDSGYVSTPGAVGSDSHFFYTADMSSTMFGGESEDQDSREEGEPEDTEHSDDSSDNEQDDSHSDCGFFLGDRYEGDGTVRDEHINADNDNGSAAQSSNLGNCNNAGSVRGNTNETNRDIQPGHSESQSMNSREPSSSDGCSKNSTTRPHSSIPVNIPKKRRSHHYLDNFRYCGLAHDNVFHTPPRGYSMIHGSKTRSTGYLQGLSMSGSYDRGNTNMNLLDQAFQTHQTHLAENRQRILRDESNPRRARFFSESLQDQHGNEGDVMAPLDGGNPVSSLRRRDRTQSAPALQTVVEFGQELRRISDNFDREYTTQPNTRVRHDRNSDNRRSFPGTGQSEPGWWQKFIQWLPLNTTHNNMGYRHRTEPVLQHLTEEQEDSDEVDSPPVFNLPEEDQ